MRRSNPRVARRRTGLLAFLILAMCAAPPLRAQEVRPLQIDALVSTTGTAAFLGAGITRAYVQLEKAVNARGGIKGRPIHFVFHDDQSNPQIAVELFNQINATNPPVILGPVFSSTCRAVIPLVTNGPVLYCLSPGVTPVKGSYVFSASISTGDFFLKIFQFLRKRGWTRVATLTTTDSTGQDADEQINRAVARPENSGITLALREHFNVPDISIAAQIERIKAANPQVLIAWTTGPPIATAFNAIQSAGLDVPVVASSANQSYALMKQYASIVPRRLYMPAQIYTTGTTPPKNRAALRTFYGAMGNKPDQLDGVGWDPAMIVLDALRNAGPNPSAADLRNSIENVHAFPGIIGLYDFRDGSNRGVGVADAIVVTWDPATNSWVRADDR